MSFKKALLLTPLILAFVNPNFSLPETHLSLPPYVLSATGQPEVNGLPGLIAECKKQLPPSLQQLFDDSLERWQTYLHENHGTFDLGRLLKAVSVAAADQSEAKVRHLLGSTMLLWDIGHIRSVNVLMASLVKDSTSSLEKIEWEFGPEVRRIVEEIQHSPSEKIENLSLSAQLIILSDRLEEFIENQHTHHLISLEEQKQFLHHLRGTSERLEQLYESFLDDATLHHFDKAPQ